VHFADIPRNCWDRLLSLTPAATPFSRWTFHRAWWDAYGDSAHEQYLACVPADSTTDRIDWELARAIVPLMHRHEVEPEDIINKTVLRERGVGSTCRTVPPDAKAVFFGASYHADYATILAAAADLPTVADAVARSFVRPPDIEHGSQPWDVVDLRRLRFDDPALAALKAALISADPSWDVALEQEDVCPVITAPSGDWDEYLATLDKKDRHEIRRKLRRAEVIGDLSIEISAPTEQAIDQFIDLHSRRFGDDGLFPAGPGGDRSRHFVHRLAELERDAADGQLHVGIVHCGPRLVWSMLAFDDGTTCFLYNAGMDPEARDVSPGISGTAMYFKDRLAAGRRRFDFLRGDEPYKYEWGARDEPIERLLVVRESPLEAAS
jgi:CelD/BcsL family acetyltransferase involved in cellulose biosynthesis